MNIKLLTKQHLKFLSLKGGCTGSSESTLVKMPYCWKSHVAAHLLYTELIDASYTDPQKLPLIAKYKAQMSRDM